MTLLSVKEVSKIFNVSSQTIRSWTAKEILKPAYKTPTNRVFYDKDEVNKLLQSGFEQEKED